MKMKMYLSFLKLFLSMYKFALALTLWLDGTRKAFWRFTEPSAWQLDMILLDDLGI